MKVSIGIPTVFDIPNRELAGLARRARRAGCHLYPGLCAVPVAALVEQARIEGLIRLPEDYIIDIDDDRVFHKGEITTPLKAMIARRREAAKARRKK